MRARLALLTLLALLLVSIAPGGGPPAAALEESEEEAWLTRLQEAHEHLAAARQRAADAEHAYQDSRQRNYPRGAPKAELLAEIDAARKQLDEAEQAFPRLLEEARRAGVSPGTLRRFEEP